MPANAGIHGGERRNWRSGARARAKALDPRLRGDDRRDAATGSPLRSAPDCADEKIVVTFNILGLRGRLAVRRRGTIL